MSRPSLFVCQACRAWRRWKSSAGRAVSGTASLGKGVRREAPSYPIAIALNLEETLSQTAIGGHPLHDFAFPDQQHLVEALH